MSTNSFRLCSPRQSSALLAPAHHSTASSRREGAGEKRGATINYSDSEVRAPSSELPPSFLLFSTFASARGYQLVKDESDGLCGGGSARTRHEYEFIVPLNLWFATTAGTGRLGLNELLSSILHTTPIPAMVTQRRRRGTASSRGKVNASPRSPRQQGAREASLVSAPPACHQPHIQHVSRIGIGCLRADAEDVICSRFASSSRSRSSSCARTTTT